MAENAEHINYALVAKTHPSMYLMHKYWARKPCNVVSEYIRHYSNPGDIVLDPFSGSGVTAIEAIKLGRKAMGIDLDPMATFIARMTAAPVDIKKMEEVFEEIKGKVREKINELYLTACPNCRKKIAAEAIIWEKNAPKEIRYSCDCSKKRLWKNVSGSDKKKLNEIERKHISCWIPQNELIWNTRVNVHKGERVSDLFTRRNLIALSILLNEIEKIRYKDIREIFKFVFTSAIANASKMIPYQGGFKTGGASWKVRGFWRPEKHFELNVWNCFEHKFNKIKRGKEESNSLITAYKEADGFEDLKKDTNIILKTFNTLELNKIIPPNSVDYVFTDPPYGDAVPYLELDYMWSSWLKFRPAFEDEIIISDSPARKKTTEIYERMLKEAFRQIYSVLKHGKWMTVTFHNTDIKVWNAVISACAYAGFDLEKIIYQAPAHISSKAGLAPYGSAVGDYYIRFRKPKMDKIKTSGRIDEERYKRIVLESAKRIIAERGEPTPYTFILNGIIVELKKEGALLSGSKNPDEVMTKFLNKEFVLVPAKDEKGKVIGKKWWFKDPSSIPYLELVPLADRVETAIVDVLRRKTKIDFDDILQEIFIKFPNALTPETQNIKEILKEYANPAKGGKWMLKPSVNARESEHSRMIYYLGILGQKMGYDVWIGTREQSEIFNSKKLYDLITNKDPVFRFIPTTNLDRVKQIDVFWHDEGRVKFEFEVENTTAITEAIVRGSNIPHDDIKRIIVIPEERESHLHRKLQEPMLQETVSKQNWKFIFYSDLEDFFKNSSRKRQVSVNDLRAIFKEPRKNKEKQNSLKEYNK